MGSAKKKVLIILPVSIGGRLTINSIIEGYRQNGCDVIVFDELFDKNLKKVLKRKFEQIIGYDFSPLKIIVFELISIIYHKRKNRNITDRIYQIDFEP